MFSYDCAAYWQVCAKYGCLLIDDSCPVSAPNYYLKVKRKSPGALKRATLWSLQKHQHLSCWEAFKLLSQNIVPSDNSSPAQSAAPASAAVLLSSRLHLYGIEDQMHCIKKQQPGVQHRAHLTFSPNASSVIHKNCISLKLKSFCV